MGKLISLIYFYLVSAAGLVLLIIGLYNSITYIINITQYNKYPLRYTGDENCDYITSSPIVVPERPNLITSTSIATGSTEERERQKQTCEQRIERERKQAQFDDLKNSIYFTFIGVLLLSIHLPIALRKSSEGK